MQRFSQVQDHLSAAPLPGKAQQRFLDATLEAKMLEGMPVHEFVDMMAIR